MGWLVLAGHNQPVTVAICHYLAIIMLLQWRVAEHATMSWFKRIKLAGVCLENIPGPRCASL